MDSHTSGTIAPEHDRIAAKLLSIAQYLLVVVFGLLPIYFLPLQHAPFVYTKVFIVSAAVFLSLVLYSFALLRSGTLKVYVPRSLILLWAVFLGAVVAALFSGDVRDALIGSTFEQHTALFVGLLALIATAWMLIGTSRDAVMHLYMLLTASTLMLAIFHLLRIAFGPSFLSLGIFGGSVLLSPIGTWNNLAIFFGLAIILALVALDHLTLHKWGRALFVAVVGVSLLMLTVINFIAVWVVLGLVSLVVLVYTLTRRKGATSDGRVVGAHSGVSFISLGVSFTTLLVSVVFILGGPVLGGVIAKVTDISYIEVRPSLSATIDIARDVYVDHAVLGYGPNRFVDAWRQYREPDINDTIFWNTDFQSGFGYIPTFFITGGVVGGLLWLGFLGLFLISGARFFLRTEKTDMVWYFIGLSSFVSGVYLWGISFMYVPGSVLLILAAMCTGLVFAAGNALAPERIRTFTLGSQQGSFIFVAIAIVFIVGSVGGLYMLGQHYGSAYLFTKSLNLIQQGTSTIEEVEALTTEAFTLSPDSEYARRLAEYSRVRLNSVLATDGGTDELQALFQSTFVNGLNAGRTAVELDDTNPNNWGTLGGFYATVVPLKIEGAYAQAQSALTRARELDPQNPIRALALAQLEYLQGNLDESRRLTEEAVRLKPNYTEAIYFLAQIDIASNNVQGAIAATRSTTLIEPENPVRHFQLGVLELFVKNYDGAVRSLERAVALNADYANARYFLAFAYDALGRRDDARSQLQWVLALNPENPDVLTLIEQLDRNQSISASLSGGATATNTEPLLNESSEQAPPAPADAPSTAGSAPDSPLLSPVNTGTETNTTEGE